MTGIQTIRSAGSWPILSWVDVDGISEKTDLHFPLVYRNSGTFRLVVAFLLSHETCGSIEMGWRSP